MMTFYLVDKESGERLREIEPDEAACIVAVKKGEASPEDEPYLSLMQKVRRDGLRIECGCRPDKPRGPLLGTRQRRPKRIFVVNLRNEDLAHAKDCEYRLTPTGPRPAVDSDVLDPLYLADTDPDDNDAEPPANRKSRGLPQDRPIRTMRGIVQKMMEAAQLNMLAIADGFSLSREFLAAIEIVAERLYLPPRIPASEFLFTDPKSWNSGEVGETTGRRQAGLARVQETRRPSLLVHPRCERIRSLRQEQGRESREGAHPGGPSDHRQ